MPKLNALALGNEQVGSADFNNMPDQRKGLRPLLPPGTYRFRFPALTAESDCWNKIDTQRGKRLNVVLEGLNGLLIVQSPDGSHNGETFDTRISVAERNRARRGEPEILASDWDYILRDVFGVQIRPQTNQQYADAIMQNCSGKEMTADVEWSWYCNPSKDIWAEDGNGGLTQVDGQKGCGATYYMGGQNGVQKVPSDPTNPQSPLISPERVTCQCGASVKAFAHLRNWRTRSAGNARNESTRY